MILVHGFTQSADSWQPVIDALPRDWDAFPIEVPEGLDFLSTASGIGLRGGTGTYVPTPTKRMTIDSVVQASAISFAVVLVTAIVSVNAESMPPDSPRTTPEKPFFST